jgi:hypothetical protein
MQLLFDKATSPLEIHFQIFAVIFVMNLFLTGVTVAYFCLILPISVTIGLGQSALLVSGTYIYIVEMLMLRDKSNLL